jgi:DNA-binding NarL/FixJ family response regulator
MSELERLSPMAQRMVRFVAQGLSDKEIAAACHCSESTVKGTLHHLSDHLGLGSGAGRRLRLVLHFYELKAKSATGTGRIKNWSTAA